MGHEFEWIVIGSGPAGQRAAVQAAKIKKKVLIIEKDDWGGACVHTGTIPSKTMREAALMNEAQLDNAWARLTQKKERVVTKETEIIARQLDRNHVERVRGMASFVDALTVAVGDKTFRGQKFLVATGTRPCRAAEFPWAEGPVYDSDSVLKMTELPQNLLVLGAGVIGCEYASIFARLGVKVTLADRRKELLRSVDAEIVDSLQKHFMSSDMELLIGCDPQEWVVTPQKKIQVKVCGQTREFSALLVCMGRDGNVEGLSLDKAGVQLAKRGLIPVNEHYQTNVSHIYAAGDIIGPPALAASSSEQGRMAACHAFAIEKCEFPALFPYGIYTIPEISSVGAQESELKEKGIEFVVGRARYLELARGQILGDEHGLLKLLVSKKDRKILGVHILGTGATELVHIGQMVMTLNGNVDFLVQNVFNYPTLAEAYKVAALNAKNQLS